ncbi:MAG: heme exporter protein CcmB [Acidobacteriota bacterium]|jgi:heme exporter protein B
MSASTWATEALAVFAKEVRSELRARVAVNAIGLFGLTTLVAVAYQIGPYQIHEQDRPHLLAALLWIILFFAALSGLQRVFVKEEDAHTAKTLRLAARPLAVWGGKLLFNVALLAALQTFLVPLYCILMGMRVQGTLPLVALLAVGCLAMAATATMVAAIIARAAGSGTLFAILAVPLMLPLLVMLIQGTRMAMTSPAWSDILPALQGVGALAGVTMVTSIYLFPVVWND